MKWLRSLLTLPEWSPVSGQIALPFPMRRFQVHPQTQACPQYPVAGLSKGENIIQNITKHLEEARSYSAGSFTCKTAFSEWYRFYAARFKGPLSLKRCIFPVAVFGSSSVKNTCQGHLNLGSCVAAYSKSERLNSAASFVEAHFFSGDT